MYRKQKRNCVAMLLAITLLPELACVNAHAALVERDWLVPGDAALTYDTDTGLEWLDLTVTADLSYNDVALQLQPGGAYEGFTYATEQQVIGLFAAVDLEEFVNAKTDEGPKIELLLSYWGVLWNFDPGERSEFFTGNTDGLAPGEHWTGRVFWLITRDSGVDAAGLARSDDFHEFKIGSALVRPATTVTVNGDVNSDGLTDTADLIIVQRIVLGYPVNAGIEPGHADYYPPASPDGIINVSDLIYMYRSILD